MLLFTAELSDEKASQDPGFVEKLITNMIRNIQITVRNIHIRYEDAVSFIATLTQASRNEFFLNFWSLVFVDDESFVPFFIWRHPGQSVCAGQLICILHNEPQLSRLAYV